MLIKQIQQLELHTFQQELSECQDDRSQHKNKAKALEYFNSRLLSAEQEKQKKILMKAGKNKLAQEIDQKE